MNVADLLTLFDKSQRIDIEYPDMRKESLPQVTRFIRPAPGMSFVLHSSLNEHNADDAIREQIAYFAQHALPFEWKVYDHDMPPDLRQRLIAHGFEVEEPDAVMVLDVEQAPAALLEAPAGDVRRITRPGELVDVIQVLEAVWGRGFDWIPERFGAHLAVPNYLSIYVAYVEQQPACAGWTYFDLNSEFASLWGGSTVPAFRRHGLYTAVLASRVREAAERGRRFLTIDASPMSRPIVARHGFQLLTYAHACEWKPPVS